MDQRIVLDEKSFRALSADSRVSILKSLGERRRTLSELSQKLSLGNSTIKEHCDILVQAELIKQIDEGRKWKYYELTQKGKQIIMPSLFDEVKVLIVLCFATLIVGGFAFMILNTLTSTTTMNSASEQAFVASETRDQPVLKATAGADSMTEINATAPQSNIICPPQGIAFEMFEIGAIAALIIGIIIGWRFTRTK
jgi:DNA-binding transcriptional ArsR family regulator